MKNLFSLGTLALLVLLPAALLAESKVMTWKVEGVERQAIVFSPSAKTASGEVPVILAFHGHGDTMDDFQEADFQVAWPQAVVVYPQGLASRRDGAPGWQVEPEKDNDRDLKMVDAILASLRKQFPVDDARIYATGFSNGASFTYLLWAKRPNVFAAYAPVAGRIWAGTHLTVPKPVIHTGGTADHTIPFPQQQTAMETARRTNGATGKGEPCGKGCTLYQSASGAPVETLIHSGGHEVPREAPPKIVEFFRKQTLKL